MSLVQCARPGLVSVFVVAFLWGLPAQAQKTTPLGAAEWTQLAEMFGLNGKRPKTGVQGVNPNGFAVIVAPNQFTGHDFAMKPLPQKEVAALFERATKGYATAIASHQYGTGNNNALWRGVISDPATRLAFAPFLIRAAFDTIEEGKRKPGLLADYFGFYYENKAYAQTVANKIAFDTFLGRNEVELPNPQGNNAGPLVSDLFGKSPPDMSNFSPPQTVVGVDQRAWTAVALLYEPLEKHGLDIRTAPPAEREVLATVGAIIADFVLPAGGGALVGAMVPEAARGIYYATNLISPPNNFTIEQLAKQIASLEKQVQTEEVTDQLQHLMGKKRLAETVLKQRRKQFLQAIKGSTPAAAKAAGKTDETVDALKAAGKVVDNVGDAAKKMKGVAKASKAWKATAQVRFIAGLVVGLAAAVAEAHLGGHIQVTSYDEQLKAAVADGVQPVDIRTITEPYEATDDDGLYYTKCAEGYEGKGPVCWRVCPNGTRDDGATCWKKRDTYGRGFGYIAADRERCEREWGGSCEQCLALYYPQCKAGYSKTTCNLCQSKTTICPEGTIDRGDWCEKGSYGRGAGITKSERDLFVKMARTTVLNTLVFMMIADPANAGKLSFDGARQATTSVSWSPVPGTLRMIDAGSIWHVWGVNAGNQVFRWRGGSWDLMPGSVKLVAVGADGEVWAVGLGGEPLRWDGLAWQKQPGKLIKQIAVGSKSAIWALESSDAVLKWTGNGWQQQAGAKLEQISVGADGTVWGTHKGNVFKRNGNRFVKMAGQLSQVAVVNKDTVYGRQSKGTLVRFTGAGWAPVSGKLAHLSAGADGALYGVDKQKILAATAETSSKWHKWRDMHRGVPNGANEVLKDRVNNNGTLFFTVNSGPDGCSKQYPDGKYVTSGALTSATIDATKNSFRATLCRGPEIPLDQITYLLPGDVAAPAGSVKWGFIKPTAISGAWKGASIMRLGPGNRTLPPQAMHFLTHNNGDCPAGYTKSGWIKNTAFNFKPITSGYKVFPAFGATICSPQ